MSIKDTLASLITKAAAHSGPPRFGTREAALASTIATAVTGDTGTGGAIGMVPAPAAGDAAAGKFLRADGTWATQSPSGGAYATTATAAGTTTLTVGSAYQQFFTGTTTQTVKLPVTSTLALGAQFRIVNNSTGVVTVQSSGANTIQAMAAGSAATLTCIAITGTGTSSWALVYNPATTGTLPDTSVGCTTAVDGVGQTDLVAAITYDFSVNGGAVSTIALGQTLPNKAVIYSVIEEVITAPTSTSSTGTYKLNAPTDGDLTAAVTANGSSTSRQTSITAPLRLTGARNLSLIIATNAILSGKVRFYVRYVLSN